MKKMIILLLVLTMIGCAPIKWKHNDHDNIARFDTDKSECWREAEQAGYEMRRSLQEENRTCYSCTANQALAASLMRGFTHGLAIGLAKKQSFISCMEMKGYYREK
jgi:hypothetical protein